MQKEEEEADNEKEASRERTGHNYEKKVQHIVQFDFGAVSDTSDRSPLDTSHIIKQLLKYVNNEI